MKTTVYLIISNIYLKHKINLRSILDDQISVKQVQLTILQNNLEKMQREYNEFLKLTEVNWFSLFAFLPNFDNCLILRKYLTAFICKKKKTVSIKKKVKTKS